MNALFDGGDAAYLTAAHPRRHPVEVQTNLMIPGR